MDVLSLTRAGVPKQLFASSLQQQYMHAPAQQASCCSEIVMLTGDMHYRPEHLGPQSSSRRFIKNEQIQGCRVHMPPTSEGHPGLLHTAH